jgi:hypothetical protein
MTFEWVARIVNREKESELAAEVSANEHKIRMEQRRNR